MSAPRLTRAQKRQANQARILAAARAVFGRRGYHQASIEEIAGEAGLSVGAVYYNFKNKEDLFLALLDDRIDERIERIRVAFSALEDPADATHSKVRDEARHVVATLKDSREWQNLFVEFVAYAARNPPFRSRLAAHRQRLIAVLTDVLSARFEALGATPPLPAAEMALAVTGLVNGLAMEELLEPGVVDEELLGEIFAAFLTAFGRPALS
jgi:AcrR family transcriptional regulator